ncbi:hypothetical protein LO762_07430 [Actinocorallia sp. API 0066]|uniref:hypothetical protein n=1 Tax=Actinocorallia sp. API 0066 TaxID=2896846 RepID=UPI001E4877CB|nr:hypothetical protein [Actinocorallia sp. API 0066]MCD0449021.1 hypothetical protein [Actinocorallia sp. API 0066]
MEIRTLPELVQTIMKEKGWTQADLGKTWGRTQAWVSLVLSGKQDVRFNQLSDMLRRVGYELVIRRRLDEAAVKRREFIASAATVTLVPGANGNPYRDPDYVSMLSDKIENGSLRSGVASAAHAAAHLRRVEHALMGGKDARLRRAASSLARNVAIAQYNTHELPQAHKAGRFAFALAQSVGDHEGQAASLNELSMFSAFEGDGLHAMQYARQALTVPDISLEIEASAHMRLGRALGLLSESRAASTHLDKAQEIGSGLPELRRADMLGGVGVALSEQGKWEASHGTLAEVVRLIAPMSPFLGVNYLACQARTALRGSQPTLAAELVDTLSRVAPLVNSERLNKLYAKILSLTNPWANAPEVKTMRDQLRTLLL